MRIIRKSLTVAAAAVLLLGLVATDAAAQQRPASITAKYQTYTPYPGTYVAPEYAAYSARVIGDQPPVYGRYYPGVEATPRPLYGRYFYPIRDYYDGYASFYYSPGPSNFYPGASSFYWSPRYWNYYYPGY